MASDGELCCESAWKNNNGILGLLTADSWMRWKFLCGEDFQGDDYHRPSKQYPGHGQNFRVLPGVSWWTRWVFTDISIKHFIPADDGCWVSLNPWEILRFYSLAGWAAQCPETLNVCFTMCRILSRLLQWFHTSFMKIVSVTELCYEGWHSVFFARSLLLCPLL